MQLRCTYCQTMFAISRDDMLAALEHMAEENLKYYDAHCPKCRRANRVEQFKLQLAYPNWKADLKAMARQTAEPPAKTEKPAPAAAPKKAAAASSPKGKTTMKPPAKTPSKNTSKATTPAPLKTSTISSGKPPVKKTPSPSSAKVKPAVKKTPSPNSKKK